MEKDKIQKKFTKKQHIEKILKDNIKNDQQNEKLQDEKDLHKEIEQLKQENADLKTNVDKLQKQLLMSLANEENTRKLKQKEVDNAKDYSIARLAGKIVNSLDVLEKSISSTKGCELDADAKNIIDGVNMTLKNIISALQDDGVEKIAPQIGEVFDHNTQQAIKTVVDESHEENTIKDVLQCGYKIKKRILRAAMVVVSTKHE